MPMDILTYLGKRIQDARKTCKLTHILIEQFYS